MATATVTPVHRKTCLGVWWIEAREYMYCYAVVISRSIGGTYRATSGERQNVVLLDILKPLLEQLFQHYIIASSSSSRGCSTKCVISHKNDSPALLGSSHPSAPNRIRWFAGWLFKFVLIITVNVTLPIIWRVLLIINRLELWIRYCRCRSSLQF